MPKGASRQPVFVPGESPWPEKIILPDDQDPEETISLGFRVRGYKKPLPLTPPGFTDSLAFLPRAATDTPSHCVQTLP